MEGLLTQLMFDLPSETTVEKVVITSACVNDGAKPEIVYNPDKRGSGLRGAPRAKLPARRKALG